jgi:hypothetical protein
MASADREKLAELLGGIDDPDLAELLDAIARDNRIALDFGSGGMTDPDQVPELPTKPVSKPGDLYILGDHRLLCGDSTKPEDVRRLMVYRVNLFGELRPQIGVDPSGARAAAA